MMRLVSKLLGLTQTKRTESAAPSLGWHPVHGANIRLSEESSLACRSQSFAQALVFSDRPLVRGERLWLRLASVCPVWRGGLRLGVTSGAPSTWARPGLPRYLCPDMTRDRRGRTWARALPEKHCTQGNVIFIQLRSNGDLIWGVNGKEKGVLVSGVETAAPVWAVVDVYGSISSVELVDPRRSLSDIIAGQEVKEAAKENKKDAGERKVIHNQEILRQRREMTRAVLSQECHGHNVSLSDDGEVARRTETEFSHGFVFLNSIMNPEETLVVRILETESSYIGSLAFGLTSADPRFLKSSELPEDSDSLSRRPEYWVSSKDVLPDPQDGDEVSFTVCLDGAVLCSVNGGPQRALFHTDISLNTRPFIDIYGAAQKIQTLGVKFPASSKSASQAPSSPSHTASTECVICYESEVDCVLYSCGHMCMCFQCAVHQWSQAGDCPICRQPIRDVIRTYRA